MSYLYSTSKTWRRIVDATSRSRGAMLAFAAACVAVPYFLGDQVGPSTVSWLSRSRAAASGQDRVQGGGARKHLRFQPRCPV